MDPFRSQNLLRTSVKSIVHTLRTDSVEDSSGSTGGHGPGPDGERGSVGVTPPGHGVSEKDLGPFKSRSTGSPVKSLRRMTSPFRL